MTEQELRALVRDAVERHLGRSEVRGAGSMVRSEGAEVLRVQHGGHASHAVYLNLINVGGECVIEPSVPCNHCNYCKSHGH